MAEVNLRNLPPGFRFCPNDIELIRYVERKNRGYNVFIPVYDISQFKPDQPPQNNCSTRGKKGELYFYAERDPNKSRQNRSVDKECFWRTTNSSMIIDQDGTVKGQKTSLVFHSGRGREGTKTEWLMQEYSLIAAASPEGHSSSAKDKKMEKVGKFVLCKSYKKATTEGETEEVSFNSSDVALVDEDGNERAFWSYILEHADDENILSRFPG